MTGKMKQWKSKTVKLLCVLMAVVMVMGVAPVFANAHLLHYDVLLRYDETVRITNTSSERVLIVVNGKNASDTLLRYVKYDENGKVYRGNGFGISNLILTGIMLDAGQSAIVNIVLKGDFAYLTFNIVTNLSRNTFTHNRISSWGEYVTVEPHNQPIFYYWHLSPGDVMTFTNIGIGSAVIHNLHHNRVSVSRYVTRRRLGGITENVLNTSTTTSWIGIGESPNSVGVYALDEATLFIPYSSLNTVIFAHEMRLHDLMFYDVFAQRRAFLERQAEWGRLQDEIMRTRWALEDEFRAWTRAWEDGDDAGPFVPFDGREDLTDIEQTQLEIVLRMNAEWFEWIALTPEERREKIELREQERLAEQRRRAARAADIQAQIANEARASAELLVWDEFSRDFIVLDRALVTERIIFYIQTDPNNPNLSRNLEAMLSELAQKGTDKGIGEAFPDWMPGNPITDVIIDALRNEAVNLAESIFTQNFGTNPQVRFFFNLFR